MDKNIIDYITLNNNITRENVSLQSQNAELKAIMKDRLEKSIAIIKELASTKIELSNADVLLRNAENNIIRLQTENDKLRATCESLEVETINVKFKNDRLKKFEKYVKDLPDDLEGYRQESGSDSVDIDKFIEVQKSHFLKE